MAIKFNSLAHVFNINDLTGTFSGVTFADDPSFIDTDEAAKAAFIDKDGNSLYGVDSEFGFNVDDFIGAEQKTLDGDFAEGFIGNILEDLSGIAFSGKGLLYGADEFMLA